MRSAYQLFKIDVPAMVWWSTFLKTYQYLILNLVCMAVQLRLYYKFSRTSASRVLNLSISAGSAVQVILLCTLSIPRHGRMDLYRRYSRCYSCMAYADRLCRELNLVPAAEYFSILKKLWLNLLNVVATKFRSTAVAKFSTRAAAVRERDLSRDFDHRDHNPSRDHSPKLFIPTYDISLWFFQYPPGVRPVPLRVFFLLRST
eukprot:SAG31_NODE_7130_length_1781_cov_1.620690_1_plen_201_part_10